MKGVSQAVPAGTKVVVQVWWRDCLLHAGTVGRGRSFSLGEGPGDLPVPSAVLGSPRELVVVHRRGAPFVLVAARAQGSLTLAGAGARPLGLLRREASFRASSSAAIEVPLPLGAEVELDLGALTVRIARAVSERGPALVLPWDARLGGSLVAGALAVLGSLMAARHAMPPLGETDESELSGETYILTYVLSGDGAPAEEEEGEAAWGYSDREPDGERFVAGPACRCHDQGMMGAPEMERREDRYGIQGPQDNPDPHLARDRGDLDAWIYPNVGLVPVAWGAAEGPIAPWGRDDSLGTDPLGARGHLWGDEIADARGGNGLGLVGSGARPGKAILSTVTAAGGLREPPRVFHTGLGIDGALDAGAVLPVVAARFLRFQGCYAEELARQPGSEGRLDVVFEVDTDGQVAELGVAQTSIASSTLPTCLLAAFEGLSFPRDEGGPTRVRYPLFFDSGKAVADVAGGEGEEDLRERP